MAYYNPSGEYTEFPAFIEYSTERNLYSITAVQLLSPEYAEYTPCTLRIPAELNPRIVPDYGEIIAAGTAPAFRLRYDGHLAYLDMIDRSERKTGDQVRCPVTRT